MGIQKNVEKNKTVYTLQGENVITAEYSSAEGKKYVTITGAIKTLAAPCLEEIISGIMANEEDFVIDMGGVSYIASAGLRVLLNMQQEIDEKENFKVTLSNLSPFVRDVLESTGFINILEIEQ